MQSIKNIILGQITLYVGMFFDIAKNTFSSGHQNNAKTLTLKII